MSSDEAEYMRRMADALRSGAKMLADQCPVCNSPLFEIKDQIWCLKCNKRVIRVSSADPREIKDLTETLISLLKALELASNLREHFTD
ncbi:MAG: Sjogren's syndrome/scleroderma autoantigen 1 family protein [Nitrososphaerota archaeon]